MVEFQVINQKIGNLIGICPDCETYMNKRVSLQKIFRNFLYFRCFNTAGNATHT